MIRGLYTGASGMAAQMHRMDAISNNMANVDLTGYKRDTAVFTSFPQLLIQRVGDDGIRQFPFGSVDSKPIVGALGTGVEFNEAYTVFEQGSLKETSNPFDLALEGKGFFVIQTPQGERYTRNGSFMIDDHGLLVTKEGFPVMGEEGLIYLKLNNFAVDSLGRIFQNADLAEDPYRLVSLRENDWTNTELVDTFKVVDFPQLGRDRYLRKQGGSLWAATENSGPPEGVPMGTASKIIQGFLEASNVNIVNEMVNMISVNRAYEANQKVVQSHDTLTSELFTRSTMGR
jgi:flagellar basal-body rod protein FlgG